ncbi:M42 family metallopeptidase [Pelobacter propionicus]|uniref:Peptidase M42 family protein n=1 Tax=Pelobacter propionicus (strain DSM 2379 / NBRC 103807 / OttBd1) TaxID=338966 RepID=A1ANT1_PELPD|nr:M42 family metallopeptidase [Pelobacter propionicus]ABK99001.1 peptidase M42 family protein [Pelobacter propionicus DSM 2379]
MRKESLKFLEKLLDAPSPSGYEQPAQRVFREYVAPFCDELTTDVMGNVFARVAGQGENLPRVMVVGHTDEIGLQVKYIDDKGFLYFAAVGGVDAHLTPGKRVNVHTAGGPLPGVIGKKPIHLMDTKDRETVVKLESQYIDIGASDKEEAQKLVRVGDAVTFASSFTRLHGDRVASRGFDDKAGCFVVAEVLRLVKASGRKLNLDLYGVSSVQEEIGLRGGTTSSYSVNPDVGICVEVDFATDQPDVEKKHNGEVGLGKGPILARGANINPRLFELLCETAESEKLVIQHTASPRATGTDANVMQISRGGVATALVKIPLRYMHTPIETVALSDLENAAKLIVATLDRITSRDEFVPK